MGLKRNWILVISVILLSSTSFIFNDIWSFDMADGKVTRDEKENENLDEGPKNYLLDSTRSGNNESDSFSFHYTDEKGDPSISGMNPHAFYSGNIDIISLRSFFRNESIIFQLEVDGYIYKDIKNTSDIEYKIFIDLNMDKESDIRIEYDYRRTMIFFPEDHIDLIEGENLNLSDPSILEVSIEESRLCGWPGISDIYASTVMRKDYGYRSDKINTGFAAGQFLPAYQGDVPNPQEDPGTSNSTSHSINVSINEFTYQYDTFDSYEYELKIRGRGTIEGDVHHCSIIVVLYENEFKSDTFKWTIGPTFSNITDRNSQKTIKFSGTGNNEFFNWSKWKFNYEFHEMHRTNSEYWKQDNINTTLDKVVVYVRAYDVKGNWNQTSLDITDQFLTKDKEETDSTPSVNLIISICIIALSFIILKKKRI